MSFSIFLVVLILGISAVLTLLLLGKSDEGYRGAARRNTINLTMIYVVVIILSLAAVGAYVRWYV
jgi:hypothetical protein